MIKQCWNKDLLKRPNALEISNIIKNWYKIICDKSINKDSENIIKEFYEADQFLKQKQINVSTSKSHPQAYHTSRLLDYSKQLNEILNQKENSGMFYF